MEENSRMVTSMRFLVPFLLLGFLSPSAAHAQPPFQGLPALEPVVLSGSQVPLLLGSSASEIWAYRYDAEAGIFVQIPADVNERVLFDLTRGQTTPVYELTYDWPGVEDGLLDADDEIAFMARDAGDRAPDTDVWVAGARDTRIEVRLTEPVSGTTGWVYLFTSGSLEDENPGFSYVSYTAPDPASGIATVETATYTIGYGGRWRLRELAIKPGPDLLDRVKGRAFSILTGETEETWEGTSEMLGALHGKVRAMREVQGAASGALTTHLDVFYRDTWRRTVNLRVHTMSHVWYYYDYLPPAIPGRFFSSLDQIGWVVDGVPEAPAASVPPVWSQTSLPGGTLVMISKELTPFPLPGPERDCRSAAGTTFYWRDDAGFDDRTGVDASAIGNHGVHIQCTADTNASPYSFLLSHYFLPPQGTYTPVGADYAAIEESPIAAFPEAQIRAGLTDCFLGLVEEAGEGMLRFSWLDALGEDGYEIYRGELFSPFGYRHDTALACDLPMETTRWTTLDDQVTGQPSYYYLIVPRRGSDRRYGTGSTGAPRPPSAAECP